MPQVIPKQMSIYTIPLTLNNGEEFTLEKYRNNVVYFVNVASKCGLTPQYDALEALFKKYKDQGLIVIALPANDFLQQEPADDAEILEFCSTKYNVTFPLLKKHTVVGENKHALVKALIEAAPDCFRREECEAKLNGFGISTNKAPELLWNFQKFLIAPEAKEVKNFSPDLQPNNEEIIAFIEKNIQ